MSLSLALARHVVNLQFEHLPPRVVASARASIADTIGVALAAGTLGEAAAAFADLARASPRGASTVLGFQAPCGPDMAAFVNGAMSHALDFEDTHDGGLVHPTGTALFAALAVAEDLNHVSGKALITAVAAGADLTCRLALAMDDETRHGWSIRPLLGAYGAAAAAGRLYQLTAEQMVQAFAFAFCQATSSSGFMAYSASHMREIRDAFAARAGVSSAQLAQRNIQCYDQPFEGKQGLYAQYCRGEYHEQRLVQALGEVFEGANVSFKPWPSCRGTHAFIEAALRLKQTTGIEPHDIEHIEASVSPLFRILTEPLPQKRRPSTANDAKFSLPYTVAVALMRGHVGLSDYFPDTLTQTAVLAVADKVQCTVNPEWGFARSLWGTLTLRLHNGQSHTLSVREPLGHPSNPMSPQQLAEKFADCARYAPTPLTTSQTQTLMQRFDRLEHLENVSHLLSLA